MHGSAPRHIRPLALQLANQIAAGEVVERPASVVKELLENSLDAGAGRIDIEVEQGGAGLIRVRDDGHGIRVEELALALAPHATSKIYSPEELASITTLGFRGEALASIASIARTALVSRSRDSEHAWRLEAVSTPDARPVPAAHPPGTTVEVCDLFYNTPARRKFLKSERTEFGHLEEVVRRVALSRFELGVSLRHNGRQQLDLRPASDRRGRERRLAEVCGRAFVEQALAVEFEAGGLRLHGWVGGRDYSRAQADLQYLFLNGRMIRDRLIGHALRQAYRQLVASGRYPAYVLFLEIDPAQVDVNVHPTKHEVRFRQPRLVHDFLLHALQGAVDSDATTPARFAAALRPPGEVAEVQGAYRQLYGVPAETAPATALHGRFLFLERPDGVLLVDAAAARERLLAARLTRDSEAGTVCSRPLLLPYVHALAEEERAALEDIDDELAGLGFDTELLGEAQMVVRRVPALLEQPEMERLIGELLAAGGDRQARVSVVARHGVQTGGASPGGTELLRELEAAGVELAAVSALLDFDRLERLLGRD